MKKLTLAVMAALAITVAFGAVSAPAAQLQSESYPTTLKSTNPYEVHQWRFASTGQDCDSTSLGGSVGGASSAVRATASNVNCQFQFSAGTAFKANGCELVLRPGAETKANVFNGAIDIDCPSGNTITFTGGYPSVCNVNVLAQKNLSATFENIGSGAERAVKVTVQTTKLHHEQVSGAWCGGSIGSYTNGSWTASWKIEGTSSGKAAGLWVQGSGGFELPPSGIAINGATPKLVAGTYPISINGAQGTQHVIALQAGNAKCTTANLATSASGPTAQLAVSGEYSGCTAFGFPATIKMNGCTYTANVLNQAPVGSTYAGHADIACPAGKAIEVLAISAGNPKCTVTIPAQTTDAGGLSFTNEAASSTIGLGLSIGGIDYHQQEGNGVGRCTTGDFTTGTYTGTSTLVGSY